MLTLALGPCWLSQNLPGINQAPDVSKLNIFFFFLFLAFIGIKTSNFSSGSVTIKNFIYSKTDIPTSKQTTGQNHFLDNEK